MTLREWSAKALVKFDHLSGREAFRQIVGMFYDSSAGSYIPGGAPIEKIFKNGPLDTLYPGDRYFCEATPDHAPHIVEIQTFDEYNSICFLIVMSEEFSRSNSDSISIFDTKRFTNRRVFQINYIEDSFEKFSSHVFSFVVSGQVEVSVKKALFRKFINRGSDEASERLRYLLHYGLPSKAKITDLVTIY